MSNPIVNIHTGDVISPAYIKSGINGAEAPRFWFKSEMGKNGLPDGRKRGTAFNNIKITPYGVVGSYATLVEEREESAKAIRQEVARLNELLVAEKIKLANLYIQS